MDVRVGLWRRLSTEELMLLNCGVGEDSWESLGLQGDPTSQSRRKSVLITHWKDWCWSWNSNTLATWCKELTHWKRPWCWVRLKAGEGDNRGWDGWMASPTQWTWIWASSGSWWWTGMPGVLQSWTRLSEWTDWLKGPMKTQDGNTRAVQKTCISLVVWTRKQRLKSWENIHQTIKAMQCGHTVCAPCQLHLLLWHSITMGFHTPG